MGAGAGYTIDGKVSEFKVNSITPKSIKWYNHSYSSIICDCDIDAIAEINNASSYYEGADINSETPCKVTQIEVFLNFGYSNSQDSDILAIFNIEDDSIEYEDDFVELVENFDLANINIDALSEYAKWYGYEKFKTLIGAGWIHHTFDGYIINDDTDNQTDGGEIDILLARLTNEQMITYIDRVVTGEDLSTEYCVYVNDEVDDAEFTDEKEAREYAMKLYEESDDDIRVVMEVFREDINGDWDCDYTETIWSSSQYEAEILSEDDY